MDGRKRNQLNTLSIVVSSIAIAISLSVFYGLNRPEASREPRADACVEVDLRNPIANTAPSDRVYGRIRSFDSRGVSLASLDNRGPNAPQHPLDWWIPMDNVAGIQSSDECGPDK